MPDVSGQVDAVSHIEPYATKAKTATKGISSASGTDIYGTTRIAFSSGT
jgi:NitT/TauT family transport system substrate-binding protein